MAGYGIAAGHAADVVLLDATAPADVVRTLAQPPWALKAGRRTFTRARPVLHSP